ncbi:MAG: hypothetical protein H7308_11955 [Chthonomonadaceae bacterium]|nr:hypothetical protein [Chthonomonadaceae bacterium]
MMDSEFDVEPVALSPEQVALMQEGLRPLVRLRQIAQDIQYAIAEDDMELASLAAELLPAVTEWWSQSLSTLPVGAGDAADLALETRRILGDCELKMEVAMKRTAQELRHLKRSRAMLEAQPVLPAVRRVDTLG